jgi:hypothetical protein
MDTLAQRMYRKKLTIELPDISIMQLMQGNSSEVHFSVLLLQFTITIGVEKMCCIEFRSYDYFVLAE